MSAILLIKLLISGIGGTLLMTAYAYLLAAVVDKRLKVVKVLGTMLSNKTTESHGLSNSPVAITIGLVAHYFVGVVFAVVYYLLWQNNIGSPGFGSAFIFGIVTGVFAVIVWRLFIALHKNAPALPLPLYLFSIFTGHVFFAEGVVLMYKALGSD